jgi:hypothetical protein
MGVGRLRRCRRLKRAGLTMNDVKLVEFNGRLRKQVVAVRDLRCLKL